MQVFQEVTYANLHFCQVEPWKKKIRCLANLRAIKRTVKGNNATQHKAPQRISNILATHDQTDQTQQKEKDNEWHVYF